MADVKVPALLHKMSKAAQKAWYKKNNMTMPSEVEGGGRSAAAAKRVVAPAPRKQMTAAPQSIRAMNAARQKAYYEKGGRQPIGAGGSGGSSSMAGVGQSSAKEIIKGIKAGYNPKVALVRYTNEEAKQMDEGAKEDAEKLLGGPVKTKPKMPPGKQPEGYRYVRALARRAMKAGLKKEEVEQVDEAGAFLRKVIPGLGKKQADDRAEKHINTALTSIRGGEPANELARMKAAAKLKNIARGNKPIGFFPKEAKQMDEARRMSAAEKLGRAFDSEQQRSALSRQRGNELLKSREKENDAVKAQTKKLKGMHEEVKDMSYGKKLAKAIMAKQSKHPIAQQMGEAVKDQADVGEYDYEGDMAKSQLRSILANAQRLHDMLEDQTNLPEWVQSKITLAEDYILTAANYMEGEMNEEVEQVDEKIDLEKAKMGDVIKDFYKSKAPQFKGKSMEKRREMAIAAKLGAERGMKEEVEPVTEKYMGFKAVMAAAKKGGARDPAAVAAAIGRKKYGKEKFQAMAAAGKKANEEVEHVTEAEGTVAVTPKEKALAAHHGDKTKITYGDVIKARLKSAAAKKMGK